MRRLVPIGLVVVLAGIVILGIASTWSKSTEDDQRAVARLTNRTKTVCVGRFLVDLPEEAQVDVGGARIDGLDIAAFQESPEEFKKRLADRTEQIMAKPDRLGGHMNLESATEVKDESGMTGMIFVHSRIVTEGTAAKGLEIEHYRYEEVAVEALVHGDGISIDLSAAQYDPDLVGNLAKLVAQLVPNPANRPPVEPGYCIDRAFFRDPLTAEQGEQLMMSASLPSHPDVQFQLILSAGLKPDEQGLLERSSAAGGWLSFMTRMRISKLRAAPREIAGLAGEELIESFREDNDARVHSFWWEVNGSEHDVLVPHFVFKMNTGEGKHQPVPSSLSEGAALVLWDQILTSIRFRPVGQIKRFPIEPAAGAAR